ncbi:MAG: glutamate--tRNA ligase, partial [Anaerolineae bacterium]|nr:glutamate--tRNA ligase [Anaerolineae bacterium]
VDIAPPPAEQLLAQGLDAEKAREVLRRTRQVLADVPDFSEEAIEPPLRALVEELGLSNRQVFGLIRIATTGKAVSPPLFGTLSILGRERVLARLEAAEQSLVVRSEDA